MEENQTVPAMIPEGDFAAFLEGEKVETLLSPLGYAYCAEGQDADLRVKRLERLEVTARRRGATPAQMEDWRMLRDRELDVEWMLNRDSVRSKARWVALQGSPLQTIASVQPREAEYLAEPYLPRGMITILAGHAGQGKTTLALWLASHVSNGDLLPGGKPGNVYYFTTENDESIVLRPRLEAMDARLDRRFLAFALRCGIFPHGPHLLLPDCMQAGSQIEQQYKSSGSPCVRHKLSPPFYVLQIIRPGLCAAFPGAHPAASGAW